MHKHLGIFTFSISPAYRLCSSRSADISVGALTSFPWPAAVDFSLPCQLVLEAPVSPANQAYLEL